MSAQPQLDRHAQPATLVDGFKGAGLFLLLVITEPKTTEGLPWERIGWSLVVRGNTVDKIEDERSREFNKAQQGSTSRPHLIETEAIENRALSREAGIRLGRRCATLRRIFRFNILENRPC